MKLRFLPLLLGSIFALVLFVVAPASASRPQSSFVNAQEDALADGDIDSEDIAARRALVPMTGGTSGRLVLGAPPGSAWVSLAGFSRLTSDDRREVGGYVVLGLPLDRFARGSTRVATPTPSAFVGISEVAQARAQDALTLQRAAAVDSAQPFDLALTPRLARACVAAAWRASGLGADDARLDAIVARARWSAILPEARIQALRSEDARLSLDTSADTNRTRDATGANVGLEARLTWRFDRLIYADDEPSFERIRLELRDARARIAAKVLDTLFHWQRAALDLRSLPPSQQGTRDEAEARLRLMEAEAALDVLTDGWFATSRPRQAPGASSKREYAAPVPIGRGLSGDL